MTLSPVHLTIRLVFAIALFSHTLSCSAQDGTPLKLGTGKVQLRKYPRENKQARAPEKIELGIEKIDHYLPLFAGKKLAVFINHTSQVRGKLLPEILQEKNLQVRKIFTPEHGLKSSADAGAAVSNDVEPKTGLPIVSLYGKYKKPTAQDLEGIDIVLFDMQDVGCRFYTYISSLEYMMEACAKYGKRLVVLDRPNPNGHYVDGPVLESGFRSFVGMQKVPIVHGMTIAEYALMLKGEKWIDGAAELELSLIPCSGYSHDMPYSISVYPSPNLRTDNAIQLYPGLCLFEGTDVSVGRGTATPFEIFGSPSLSGAAFPYTFVPKASFGSSNPKHKSKSCHGQNLKPKQGTQHFDQLPLDYLLQSYAYYKSQGMESKFFNSFFDKLAGTDKLKSQIKAGWSEDKIRASWAADLQKFKSIRQNYLLYP